MKKIVCSLRFHKRICRGGGGRKSRVTCIKREDVSPLLLYTLQQPSGSAAGISCPQFGEERWWCSRPSPCAEYLENNEETRKTIPSREGNEGEGV